MCRLNPPFNSPLGIKGEGYAKNPEVCGHLNTGFRSGLEVAWLGCGVDVLDKSL